MVVFVFVSIPGLLRDYFWVCTYESLPEALREPIRMLGIKPGLTACKARILPAVLLLRFLEGNIWTDLRKVRQWTVTIWGKSLPCLRDMWTLMQLEIFTRWDPCRSFYKGSDSWNKGHFEGRKDRWADVPLEVSPASYARTNGSGTGKLGRRPSRSIRPWWLTWTLRSPGEIMYSGVILKVVLRFVDRYRI